MSSQQGPKAAPVQHSAHILLRFILREPQSTTGNFLENVGEGVFLGGAVRRCLRPRRCVRRRGVRSGHTEQCQSAPLRILTLGLCASRFSRCRRRYCFRGPCTCIRWGGACIRRGVPAFSMQSPSRQLGVHQGAVNCMSRIIL